MAAVTTWIPADTFGARLAILRQRLGLNVSEAAKLCGMSSATWFKWEDGASPRLMGSVVTKIVAATGVDRDWLMWGGPLGAEGDPRSKCPSQAMPTDRRLPRAG